MAYVRIPTSIGKLKNLQYLYIANGKFEGFEQGTDLSGLENLTDIEIYNCPSMKKLPEELTTITQPSIIQFSEQSEFGRFS